MSRCLAYSSAVYRNLLWVCPPDLRRDFGSEMTLVFADDLSESCQESGIAGAVRVWSRAIAELAPIALSRAASEPGFLVPAISCVLSAVCLGGELMLARAHAPAEAPMPALAEAITTVVVWPSLIAALVSLVAIRVCARTDTLSLRAE